MTVNPKKTAQLSMTVRELTEKLKEMEQDAQIVSLSPNYELKEQLVAIKNLSLCRCRVSEKSNFNHTTDRQVKQIIYDHDENNGFACVKLSFYGPQRIRSSVKNLIELLYQADEEAIVVANAIKPPLLFKMLGIKCIRKQNLSPGWQTSTDVFDQSPVESLVFKMDDGGDINGVVLEF